MLVANIGEVEGSLPHRGPGAHRLEQMKRHQVFKTRPIGINLGPIPKVQFGLFPNCPGHLPSPRRDPEGIVESIQYAHPGTHGFKSDPQILAHGIQGKRTAHPLRQQAGQHFEQRQFAQGGGIANILAHQPLRASRAPGTAEGIALPQEWLGKPTQSQQRPERLAGRLVLHVQSIEVFLEARPCGPLARKLGQGQWKKEQRHVAPEEAVTPALVDIQPPTAGDQKGEAIPESIEDPLQVVLPAGILVKFVEHHQGKSRQGDRVFLEEGWILGQDLSIRGQIPIEIASRTRHQQGLGKCGLTNLARTRHEDHLAPVIQDQAHVLHQQAFNGHAGSLDRTLKRS